MILLVLMSCSPVGVRGFAIGGVTERSHLYNASDAPLWVDVDVAEGAACDTLEQHRALLVALTYRSLGWFELQPGVPQPYLDERSGCFALRYRWNGHVAYGFVGEDLVGQAYPDGRVSRAALGAGTVVIEPDRDPPVHSGVAGIVHQSDEVESCDPPHGPSWKVEATEGAGAVLSRREEGGCVLLELEQGHASICDANVPFEVGDELILTANTHSLRVADGNGEPWMAYVDDYEGLPGGIGVVASTVFGTCLIASTCSAGLEAAPEIRIAGGGIYPAVLDAFIEVDFQGVPVEIAVHRVIENGDVGCARQVAATVRWLD